MFEEIARSARMHKGIAKEEICFIKSTLTAVK